MKKLISSVFILFIINLAIAQKVRVTESTEVIDKISRTGLSTIIELDNKKVEKAWEKQLKTYGKVDYSKGVYRIPVANIPSVSSSPCVVTSIVKSTGKGTMVWWSIDLGKDHVSPGSSAYKAAEKILNEFALQAYRDDINDQIQEAEKALANSVKAQEKQVKEGENLVRSVEKNKQEKANLERKLKENADELVQLQKDIEQNKKDQAAAAQDVEKMKKALEAVKNKLNQVGQ
jgi:hypothetical protein